MSVRFDFELKFPPDWACGWGQDEFGLFAEFAVKGVVQRMRWLEAGAFWMGEGDERHRVSLTTGFWLADTQCTQALWKAVMDGDNLSRSKRERRPVVRMSWDDTEVFLKRLAELAPWLKLRLPTEAEWEYGCRAGTETLYWWGDDGPAERALYGHSWDYKTDTEVVDARAANPWGLYGVTGNVWEWCSDWYARYEAGDQINPTGPEAGDERVLRGGSFFYAASSLRSAYRFHGTPGGRSGDYGFRLARGR